MAARARHPRKKRLWPWRGQRAGERCPLSTHRQERRSLCGPPSPPFHSRQPVDPCRPSSLKWRPPPPPHPVNGTGSSPSPGQPTPGVVKQDKSSEGSVDTTKTRSGPQRVRMSSGERPMNAAKGKQSDTEALCQPPAHTQWNVQESKSHNKTLSASKCLKRDRHSTCTPPSPERRCRMAPDRGVSANPPRFGQNASLMLLDSMLSGTRSLVLTGFATSRPPRLDTRTSGREAFPMCS